MSEIHQERRRFERIATDKVVEMRNGDTRYTGTVLDISLRGLLLEIEGDWRPRIDTPMRAEILLDDKLHSIVIDGEVAHVKGRHIGLRCVGMDLDSASKLRRLVELNLQDEQLLERNLAQLLSA